VAQSGSGEVQGRLPVREGPDHTRASPDLAQEALERVVGADARPVLPWEGVVGQGPFDPASASSAALVRRKPRNFSIPRRAFSRAATTSSLAWIALSMVAISRTLVAGTWLKMLRYQCTMGSLKKLCFGVQFWL
jgi:hypothetical protein